MTTALKDYLAQPAVESLAAIFSQVYPAFAADDFVHQALLGLSALELKQRVQHIIGALAAYLPTDFSQTAVLLQQVPQHWPSDSAYFRAWPVIDYVAVYGLEHPELALQTLKVLTPLFTAEFAIRAFLQQHFELTYGYLQQWAQDENPHVRRLASEGCRPRLPWGQRVPYLMTHPEPILGILEQLKDDDSDYVRRSVANNLNDISKDYPDLVVTLAQQWLAQPTTHRQWIVKHATRGLVKAGHADALAVLGFSQALNVQEVCFSLNKSQVSMNDTVQLSLSFYLPQAQNLVIDYALHLPRANGKKSLKVFKWKTGLLAAGQHQLRQSYGFKIITTRRYYQGEHGFEVLINGQPVAFRTVELVLN